jgi:chorismate dehydratase
VKDYPHVADLGEVWRRWTGLPFVFARWMAARGLPEAEKARLVRVLDNSLSEGWSHFESVVSPRAADLHMTIEEMREYLQGFRFRMTAAEHQSIEKFRRLDAAVRGDDAAPWTAEEPRAIPGEIK